MRSPSLALMSFPRESGTKKPNFGENLMAWRRERPEKTSGLIAKRDVFVDTYAIRAGIPHLNLVVE